MSGTRETGAILGWPSQRSVIVWGNNIDVASFKVTSGPGGPGCSLGSINSLSPATPRHADSARRNGVGSWFIRRSHEKRIRTDEPRLLTEAFPSFSTPGFERITIRSIHNCQLA
ncbi:hypothetical protein MGYG_00474 [Nannizzia gypsea CBS 118893]|uniref:Uncharacterized protein n=1 Tax=Arthroderma gypseum (strain ATCC MYA-4604 / CBS 118893) TaxID=535722 RepID=E5QZX0_ARTGP|nr:hypothetical protein MGYG_00474 [Nannizzia gypsea CBS 118893]EFQ97433.1 hypothetical protein MGYG_00474 [Nannizzia gypsea CBS 118893]